MKKRMVPPESHHDETSRERGWNLCVCASGSVACVKTPELVRALLAHPKVSHVDLVLSEAAIKLSKADYKGSKPWKNFDRGSKPYDKLIALERSESSRLKVHCDIDEWSNYTDVGESSVLHVELAKRNDLLLIAPLCANTLAAAALGLCSNLLCSVVRAWPYDMDDAYHEDEKPVVVAPAMNTIMWHQRITRSHLAELERRGAVVVPPTTKTLACGDVGTGAMAEVKDIVDLVAACLESRPPLAFLKG